jgi:hypothetical protein
LVPRSITPGRKRPFFIVPYTVSHCRKRPENRVCDRLCSFTTRWSTAVILRIWNESNTTRKRPETTVHVTVFDGYGGRNHCPGLWSQLQIFCAYWSPLSSTCSNSTLSQIQRGCGWFEALFFFLWFLCSSGGYLFLVETQIFLNKFYLIFMV